MPLVAASLNEAIALTNSRAAAGNPGGFLNFQISTFTSTWKPNFDPDNAEQRTVRNWVVQSEVVVANTPVTGSSQQIQNVADIACRVMYATQAAFAAGRITVGQRDAVLGAWNASFGTSP